MSEEKVSKIAERTFRELEKLKIVTPADYVSQLSQIMRHTSADHGSSEKFNNPIPLSEAIARVSIFLHYIRDSKKNLMVIGNGGSAAMAIHTMVDYVNVGGIRVMDFTNPALLTCMANDYGYENVYATPIEKSANEEDLLFAISSSGSSPNILKACESALNKGCTVVTFSGMKPENKLRRKGLLNFYVPSTHYPFIELTHEMLLNAILDFFVKDVRNAS